MTLGEERGRRRGRVGPQRVRVVLRGDGRPHARPLAHVARSRRQVAGEDLQERGFPGAVRPDQRTRARPGAATYLSTRRRRHSPHGRCRATPAPSRRPGSDAGKENWSSRRARPRRATAGGRVVERLQTIRLVALAVVAAQADALDLGEPLLRLAQGVVVRMLLATARCRRRCGLTRRRFWRVRASRRRSWFAARSSLRCSNSAKPPRKYLSCWFSKTATSVATASTKPRSWDTNNIVGGDACSARSRCSKRRHAL